MGKYYESGSAEKVTIQKNGTFDVIGYGAQGGGASKYGTTGGSGAEVGGSFTLQKNEVLELFVGQQGGVGTGTQYDGGGGGGTFVLADVNAQGTLTPGKYTLLLAAGGGGGAGAVNGGKAGTTPQGTGLGGAGGSGNHGAGGGAGFNSNGGQGSHQAGSNYYGNGGIAVTSSTTPGAGGVYNGGGQGNNYTGNGGFGGGGSGGGSSNGGGGGGYTGGVGGSDRTPGSGGYSFFSTLGTADATQMVAGAKTGNGLVKITPSVMCFAAGTRIATTRGEVAVEDLAVGDLVITASGEARPIRWLGHRTIDCRRHPRPRDCRPIRVMAHTFGDNRPSRDLYLSPGHSVCVDVIGEVLIPVGRLINGATIAQLDVDTVTYWHVELDSHDILLAENLPAESYIDCGTRAFFAENDVVSLGASPDAPVLTTDDYCRPFRPEGALVDMVRDRLCLRAADLGWRLAIEDELAGLWLEVDGRRIEPARNGLLARVTLPADAREVRVRSDAAVPADLFGDRDERHLGLQLASVVIDDGLGCRHEIACADERLADGFHPHEGMHRWTDGDACLPSELWEGCRDSFQLRLAFAGPALPRWVAPDGAAEADPSVVKRALGIFFFSHALS